MNGAGCELTTGSKMALRTLAEAVLCVQDRRNRPALRGAARLPCLPPACRQTGQAGDRQARKGVTATAGVANE